jgi:HK97 family phage major capsid protein
MATDYANLIPRGMASEVLQLAAEQSVVLELGNTQRMPTGVESIPLVSFFPVAGFVNPVYGGRKPATKIEWTAQQVQAEELAAVLAIPNAFVDDAGFPVWENVRTQVASAMARTLDRAVLFGDGAPASFPTGGIQGIAGAAVTGADAPAAIDAALAAVEASGGTPDGIAAGAQINTALRQANAAQLLPYSAAPAMSLYGLPVRVTRVWDDTAGDALAGDWQYLLVGIREDMTFDTSADAILQDGTGAIIANAFQDDLTAMRCYMRVGVAIGQPVDAITGDPVAPFAFADWTGP